MKSIVVAITTFLATSPSNGDSLVSAAQTPLAADYLQAKEILLRRQRWNVQIQLSQETDAFDKQINRI